MLGQTLGHYRILEKLGEGGMGEVYLAEDISLKRRVALKIVPADLAGSQDRMDRFQHEAENLAALDHPNIVSIHSVEEVDGVRFLTMQLVEGTTLAQQIPHRGAPLDTIFAIGIPLADALAAAHAKGVVHRDFKPANIMLTADGWVKVVDFGLAKFESDAFRDADSRLPTEPMTSDSRIVGTIPYMSPEQLEKKAVDHRSDIFSLGVVLYELATGQRPFSGASPATVVSAILRDSPLPPDRLRPDLPHHLSRIILQCLEKSPEDRFQAALDVRNELRFLAQEVRSEGGSADRPIESAGWTRRRWAAALWTGAVVAVIGLLLYFPAPGDPGSPIPSGGTEATRVSEAAAADIKAARPSDARTRIVVLPFQNLGAPEDDYFAAGITEEITSRLAASSGMGVISRKTAERYSESDKTIPEIGAELDVDYVLEGTVRWAEGANGGRVRITPQLIRVTDDTHIWADTFERVIEDIFAIQSEIARTVLAELDVSLPESEPQGLDAKPTTSPAAYRAFLRGREIYRRPLPVHHGLEQPRQAAKLFAKAVELDPTFARAWAWLSRMKGVEHFWGAVGPDLVAEAQLALDRATELAPDDYEVRLANGYYHYYVRRDFDHARQLFEELSAELPNNSEVLVAIAAILRRQGRFEESVETQERALVLDPQNVGGLFELATTLRALRRIDEAVASLDRAIDLAPENAALYEIKADCLRHQGKMAAARAALAQAPVREPMHQSWFWVEFFSRDFEAALSHARLLPRDEPLERLDSNWMLSDVLYQIGREDEAGSVVRATLDEAERLSAAGSIYSAEYLGWFYARLGKSKEAIQAQEELLELNRDDLYRQPMATDSLAYIHAFLGNRKQAVEAFRRLLTIPYGLAITAETLRLDPRLDPLRDLPEFQALVVGRLPEEEQPIDPAAPRG